MFWEDADRRLHHERTGVRMEKKNVEHNTYLERDKGLQGITLFFHEHPLIRWEGPGRNLGLTNSDFWTRTTQRRINAFMPRGFQVWQRKPYWFLRTPRTVLAWHNNMEVTLEGLSVGSYHPGVASRRADELQDSIELYAKEYVGDLLRGLIQSPLHTESACAMCRRNATVENSATESPHALTHLLGNERDGQLMLAAVAHADAWSSDGLTMHRDVADQQKGSAIPRQVLRDAVGACWTGTRALLLKPRTRAELIRQTEAKMTAFDTALFSNAKPRTFAWNMRRLLADYILDSLNFCRMK